MFDKLNNVLVVDDDPAIQRLLQVLLKGGGYEVSSASDGRQAIELVRQKEPSYVITDWEMPGMDGLELCRRIRALDLNHYVYIVFLTGRAGEEDLRTAMDAGADDFLVKPLRKQELFARLTAGSRVVRLESHLSQLATQDALTGLLVRRAFSGYLDKEWHHARRSQRPLSLVMLDIDHFKKINDTHGHPAGDAVIHGVAGLIRGSSRKSDVLCRYGGEEFCVLLPDTDEASACGWADSLRARVAETSIPVGDSTLEVTVSAGVAALGIDLEIPADFVKLSDDCLLAAKQLGRNRVVSRGDLVSQDPLDGLEDRSGLAGVLARDAMTPLSERVESSWSIAETADYLVRSQLSSVPVADEAGGLLGVLSDKDLLTLTEAVGWEAQHVTDVVRTNAVAYDEATPLGSILSFMNRSLVSSVIVTTLGKPSGVISRMCLLRWLLAREAGPAEGDPRQDDPPRLVAASPSEG